MKTSMGATIETSMGATIETSMGATIETSMGAIMNGRAAIRIAMKLSIAMVMGTRLDEQVPRPLLRLLAGASQVP